MRQKIISLFLTTAMLSGLMPTAFSEEIADGAYTGYEVSALEELSTVEPAESESTLGNDRATFDVMTLEEDYSGYNQVASGSCGEALTWTLYDEGTLVISGSGAMKGYASNSRPTWNTYAASIRKVIISDGVTEIGKFAFYNDKYITDVVIGSGVKTIREKAFQGAAVLKNVSWGAAIEVIEKNAFYNCKVLTDIILPDTTKTVGASAFEGCEAVEALTLGKIIESIGASAFRNTKMLKEINYKAANVADFTTSNYVFYNAGISTEGIKLTFSEDVMKIPAYAFYVNGSTYAPKITEVTIGNGVTEIGTRAFDGCKYMTDLKIGNGVKVIADKAFNACIKLTNVTWGTAIENIGNNVFYGCKAMESIILPDTTKTVGTSAFDGCEAVKTLTLGKSIESIGAGAFKNTKMLEEINYRAVNVADLTSSSALFYYAGYNKDGIKLTVDDGVLRIPAYMFYANGSTYAPKITEVTIGNDVTEIGTRAFDACKYMTGLVIGNSVKTIGEKAFYACSKLQNTTWGTAIEEVGKEAFKNCSLLSTVVLPDTIKTVGVSAFEGCSAVVTLTVGENAEAIGDRAFYNLKALNEIYWKAANVSDFLSTSSLFYYAGIDKDGINLTFGDKVKRIPAYMFYVSGSYTPKIKNVIIPENVIEIGDYAFNSCKYITGLVIEDGVTTIGTRAFYNCAAITNVTVPDSVTSIGAYAFSGCKALTEATLGNGCATIPESCFANCTVLEKLVIPDSVKTIEANAFSGAAKNKEVYLESVQSWFDMSFAELYAFPLAYGGSLYVNGELLTELVVPEGVTEIGKYVMSVDSVKSVTIPKSVTYIADGAFQSSNSLEKIVFKGGNITFGSNVFWQYHQIKEIHIPSADFWFGLDFGSSRYSNPMYAGSVGLYVDGEPLKTIEIPEGTEAVKEYALYKCPTVENVVIPDSVTAIGNMAFAECTNLKSVTIGSGVTTIGDYAFQNAVNLEEINWNAENVSDLSSSSFIFDNGGIEKDGITLICGEGVKRIPAYAFFADAYHYYPNITSIRLPKGFESFGSYAFNTMDTLTDIYFGGTKEEWATVSKGSYNSAVSNATMHYNAIGGSDGDDGNYGEGGSVNDTVTWFCKDGVLTISGTGAMNDYTNSSYSEWNSLRSTIKEVIIEDGITHIGNNSFGAITSLEKITIADSVTTIGNSAFQNCSSLTEAVISDNVTSVGAYAFSGCTSLASLTIGKNVTAIGTYAFNETNALTEIYYNAKNVSDLSSYNYVFGYSGSTSGGIKLVIGEGVERIPANIFNPNPYNSTYQTVIDINEVTIPESVTSIGTDAFCISTVDTVRIKSLEKWVGINFANGGANPLKDAESLYVDGVKVEALEIGGNVTSVNAYAFYDFEGIKELTVGENVSYVGDSAFYGMRKLEKINWNAVNVSDFTKNSNVFKYAGLDTTGAAVSFGEAVESIPAYMFYSANSNITEVTISSGVTDAGSNAFYYLSTLSKVYTDDLEAWCGIEFADYYANPLYYATEFYVDNVLVNSNVVIDSAEKIGAYAFYGFKGLNGITIGASVKKIGNYAFAYCPGLSKINYNAVNAEDLTSSSRIFYNSQNTDGVELVIGNGVARIPQYMFASLSKYTSVMIPASVKEFANVAFASGSIIEEVYIQSLNSWCMTTFVNGYSNPLCYAKELYIDGKKTDGRIVIDDSIKAVSKYAFYGFKGLTALELSDGIESIGNDAFSYCTNLTDLIFKGESFKRIGNSCFYNCNAIARIYIDSLKDWCETDFTSNYSMLNNILALYADGEAVTGNVTIPEGTTEIGAYAFGGYKGITSVTIPDSVTYIGSNAFANCTEMTSVAVGSGVMTVGSNAFYNCSKLNGVYIKDLDSWCGISFGGSYSNPLRYAGVLYENYDIVNRVNFPEGMLAVNPYTFDHCKFITSVTLPDGIESIGKYAFDNCTNLKDITFTSSVTDIYDYAFNGCTAFKDVYYYGDYEHYRDIYIRSTGNSYIKNATVNYMTLDDTCGDNLTWSVDANGVMRISGTGAMRDYESASDAPWYYVRSSIKVLAIDEGVTSIGKNAFGDATNLLMAQIPGSIEEIGLYAFSGTARLTDVYFGGTEEEFGRLTEAMTELEAPYVICDSGRGNISAGGAVGDGAAWMTDSSYSLVIGGTGYVSSEPWSSMKDSIKEIIIGDGITGMYDYMLQIYINVESVTIGKNMNSFETMPAMFNGAYSLKTLYWNATNLEELETIDSYYGAFLKDAGRDSGGFDIIFGDGVLEINNTFKNNMYINNVYIPASVKRVNIPKDNIKEVHIENLDAWCSIDFKDKRANPISNGAKLFADGKAAEGDITIGENITYVSDFAFANYPYIKGVAFADNITYVGKEAFSGCNELTAFTADSLETIGEYAFNGCEKLTAIDIKNVTTIGANAFSGCTSIEEVEFGNDVTEIPQNCFAGCTALKEVTFTENVTKLNSSAFMGCTSLSDIYYGGSIAEWEKLGVTGSSINNATIHYNYTDDTLIDYGTCGENVSWTLSKAGVLTISGTGPIVDFATRYNDWLDVTELVVEEGLTAIPDHLFYNHHNLEKVTIAGSVKVIGEQAFDYCEKLTEVSLGYGIEEFKEAVFGDCTALKEITIPGSIRVMDYNSFTGCESLEKVVIEEGVPYIYNDAFIYCTALKEVTIPESVKSIGVAAFGYCTALDTVNYAGTNEEFDAIDIDDGNKSLTYAYKNGAVYTGNGRCGDSLEWEMESDGTLRISGIGEMYDFDIADAGLPWYKEQFARNVKRIVIEDNVTSIGAYTFWLCFDAEEIVIGNGVSRIGAYIVGNCDKLRRIFYIGSEQDWNDIDIAKHNPYLLGRKIYFLDRNVNFDKEDNVIFVNHGEDAGEVLVLVALYNESGEMLGVKSVKADITKGITAIESPIKNYFGAYRVKILGWRSLDTMESVLTCSDYEL